MKRTPGRLRSRGSEWAARREQRRLAPPRIPIRGSWAMPPPTEAGWRWRSSWRIEAPAPSMPRQPDRRCSKQLLTWGIDAMIQGYLGMMEGASMNAESHFSDAAEDLPDAMPERWETAI